MGQDFSIGDLVLGIRVDTDGLEDAAERSGAALDHVTKHAEKLKNVTEGGHGGHGGGRFSTQLLRVVGRELGIPQVGEIAHIHHLVHELAGSWAMVLTAAAAVGLIYHSIHESQLELHKAQIEYNEELEKSDRKWAGVQRGLIETTAAGKEFRSTLNESLDQAADKMTALKKANTGGALGLGQTAMIMTEAAFTGGIGNTSYGKRVTLELEQVKNLREMAHIAAEWAKIEEDTQRSRSRAGEQMANDAARINLMFEGPLKERAKIEQDTAKQIVEARQGVEDQINQNAFAGEMRSKAATSSKEVLKIDDETADEAARIKQRGNEKIASIQQQGAIRSVQIQINERELLRKNAESWEDARISLHYMGFAREYQLLLEHNRVMHDEAVRAGHDTTMLDRANETNRLAMIKKNQIDIATTYADMTGRLNTATRAVPDAEIQWTQFSRHLVNDLSVSSAQLTVFHDLFMQTFQAEANAPLVDEMKNLNIELNLARWNITSLDAAYGRLQIQHRNASTSQLHELAAAQERVRLQQFVNEQMAARDPKLKFGESMRDIREALSLHVINLKEAQKLATYAAFDSGLTKPINAGSFSTEFSKGVDVNKINLDPKNATSFTLKANGQTLVQINDKLGKILAKEVLQ